MNNVASTSTALGAEKVFLFKRLALSLKHMYVRVILLYANFEVD